MNSRLAAAFAVGLMLQSATAFADASATASFSNIAIELIDLDPGDGISPAVTFSGLSSALAFMYSTPPYQTSQVANSGATSFAPVSAALPASTSGGASASFSGDVYQGTGKAMSSSWVKGLQSPFGATTYALGRSVFGDDASPTGIGFVLSPHTELIITGLADVEGESTPGGDGQQTESIVDLYIDVETFSGPQHREAHLHASLDGTLPFGAVTDEQNLLVSVSNGDATATSGRFDGLVGTRAVSFVPEPSTAAMLMAAIAGILLTSVQRKRN